MKVYAERARIYFHDEKQDVFGYTDFTKELWDKVESVNWKVIWGKPNSKGIRKGYIGTYSKKLGKKNKLHQIVMTHWYGEEALKEAYEKEFIIEHMNNNSFDCLIQNLSFAPNNVNIAKGQTYDVERKEAITVAAINMFKDFDTQKFQITVGFNKEAYKKTESGSKGINALKLVYEDYYRRTLLDAENIVYELVTNGRLDTSKLNHIHLEEEPAIYVHLNEDEKDAIIVERNGKTLLILDEHVRLLSVAPDQELYNK